MTSGAKEGLKTGEENNVMLQRRRSICTEAVVSQHVKGTERDHWQEPWYIHEEIKLTRSFVNPMAHRCYHESLIWQGSVEIFPEQGRCNTSSWVCVSPVEAREKVCRRARRIVLDEREGLGLGEPSSLVGNWSFDTPIVAGTISLNDNRMQISDDGILRSSVACSG